MMYFTEKGLLDCKRQDLTVKVCIISGSEVDIAIHSHATITKLKEESLEVLEVVNKEKMLYKSKNYKLLNVRTGCILEDDLVVGLVIDSGDELVLIPKRTAEQSVSEYASEAIGATAVDQTTTATSQQQQSTVASESAVSGTDVRSAAAAEALMSVDVGVSGSGGGSKSPLPQQAGSDGSAQQSAAARQHPARSPSRADILQATSHHTPAHHDRRPKEHLHTLDFGSELQKILVTFVETSLKLVAMDPSADEVLTEISEKIEFVNSGKAGRVTAVDSDSLQQLMDMGFTNTQATKALQLCNNNVVEASEWLLKEQCVGEAAMDDDTGSASDSRTGSDVNMTTAEPALNTSPAATAGSTVEVLPNYHIPVHAGTILKACKEYQRKTFKPNEAALQHFKEMGFDESSILDALREAGNKEDLACDMLLGERSQVNYDNLSGLDPNHSIYKSIMSNPIIVTSLSNPKNLLVFLNMLENLPNLRSTPWVADADMSPLFSQVFRLYHTENYQLK